MVRLLLFWASKRLRLPIALLGRPCGPAEVVAASDPATVAPRWRATSLREVVGLAASFAGIRPRRYRWNNDDRSRGKHQDAGDNASNSRTRSRRRRPFEGGRARAGASGRVAASPLPREAGFAATARIGSALGGTALAGVSGSVQPPRERLSCRRGPLHAIDPHRADVGHPSREPIRRRRAPPRGRVSRRLDLCGEAFRQPPACSAMKPAASGVADPRNPLQRAVDLHADELLRLGARTSRTLHERRGDAAHPRSPIPPPANDLARRDTRLVSRGNPCHVGPTRKRARVTPMSFAAALKEG